MADSKERRKCARISAAHQYFINIRDKTITGVSFNVSPFGIAICSDSSFDPGYEAHVRLFIQDMNLRIQANGEVIYCIDNPYKSTQPFKYLIGIRFTEGPLEDLTVTTKKKKTSYHAPTHTITINADAKRCYELLADYKRYPEWTSGVKEAKVLTKYPDGRGHRVEFAHDFFLRKVKYVLDYVYDDEKPKLSWISSGGDDDILIISGSYLFNARDKNITSATYTLYITLRMLPSQYLVQYITNILMLKEMGNFKKFVEKNSG